MYYTLRSSLGRDFKNPLEKCPFIPDIPIELKMKQIMINKGPNIYYSMQISEELVTNLIYP